MSAKYCILFILKDERFVNDLKADINECKKFLFTPENINIEIRPDHINILTPEGIKHDLYDLFVRRNGSDDVEIGLELRLIRHVTSFSYHYLELSQYGTKIQDYFMRVLSNKQRIQGIMNCLNAEKVLFASDTVDNLSLADLYDAVECELNNKTCEKSIERYTVYPDHNFEPFEVDAVNEDNPFYN